METKLNMTFPNLFSAPVTDDVIARIHALKPESKPSWGVMNAAQMMAHCCVPYEMVYDGTHPTPGFLKRFLLKTFLKKTVTGPGPYKHNTRTAPAFLVTTSRDFELEKGRLIAYMQRMQKEGASALEKKESLSFGPLTTDEWNTMFYKHINHHLTQFGV